MKKIYATLVTFLVLNSSCLIAQGDARVNLVDLEYLYQGNRINIFDLRPREQEGTFYFSEEWMEGAILYKNGNVLTDHMVRYNQKDNSIEIKSGIGILELPGYYVKEFTLQKLDHKGQFKERIRFINPAQLNGGFAFNIGFLEEIYSGKMSLYSAHKAELVRADYVPILSAGNTRSRIIKRKKRFLFDGRVLMELPKQKGKILGLLERYKAGVVDFVKDNKISLKSERGMKQLMEWLDQDS